MKGLVNSLILVGTICVVASVFVKVIPVFGNWLYPSSFQKLASNILLLGIALGISSLLDKK